MISEREQTIILKCAEKYSVSSVYLFGSSIRADVEPRDIDIGVKVRPDLFFKFYGELIQQLPKPVDVVDLSKQSLFTDLVEQEGVRIYG
ncbi:MAG: nucleotidyltransferase family protein [Terriglobia bacterium]